MRDVVRLAVVILAVVAGLHAAPAGAERRVALVIGNSLYGHHAALANVPNDAAAMAALLKGAGFDSVVVRPNLGMAALRAALRDFAAEVATADVAVLFYAGHGIEVGGINYLIPVDARLATDYDVKDETVELDRVLEAMAPAKRLRLVILDACRDNPFVKGMKRTGAGRDVGRGLSRYQPSVGNTLIAFATKPNAIALDGKGPNSPFTAALVKHLATPGHDVRLALGDVRDDVLASTGGKQEPYLAGSLGSGVFAIVGGAPKPVATPPVQALPDAAATAARICREVEGMSNPEVLAVLERQHKGTPAGECVAARLAQLSRVATPKAPEPAEKLAPGILIDITPKPAEKPPGIYIRIPEQAEICERLHQKSECEYDPACVWKGDRARGFCGLR